MDYVGSGDSTSGSHPAQHMQVRYWTAQVSRLSDIVLLLPCILDHHAENFISCARTFDEQDR